MTPMGEPFLSDGKIAEIEGRVRQEFPRLPENTIFLSYVQPEMWADVQGISRKIPESAVLNILAQNPRNPDQTRIFQSGTTLARWRAMAQDTRHDAVLEADPAYRAFRQLALEVIEYDESLRSLLN